MESTFLQPNGSSCTIIALGRAGRPQPLHVYSANCERLVHSKLVMRPCFNERDQLIVAYRLIPGEPHRGHKREHDGNRTPPTRGSTTHSDHTATWHRPTLWVTSLYDRCTPRQQQRINAWYRWRRRKATVHLGHHRCVCPRSSRDEAMVSSVCSCVCES